MSKGMSRVSSYHRVTIFKNVNTRFLLVISYKFSESEKNIEKLFDERKLDFKLRIIASK